MPKQSKSERKEDRIQILEQELASAKKRNAELQQQKTVLLNDTQLESFLEELTDRINWSTNKIVDEMPHSININPQSFQRDDSCSTILKFGIGIPFFMIAFLIGIFLNNIYEEYWNLGWTGKLCVIILVIVTLDCLALGVEIFKAKDKNYIVSLFSALVALVALIVSVINFIFTLTF